jgi:hypothetical protein
MSDQQTVEQQIQQAVQRLLDESDPESKQIVTGWVVSYESASVELMAEGMYGGGNITPDAQSPAMSRGMAQNAVDFYNPTNWRIGHRDD